jgi:hypothetical protein
MSKTLLVLAILWTTLSLSAQIDVKEDTSVVKWKKGNFIAFSVNQSTLSNWAAGGENALSLSAVYTGFRKYRLNDLYFEQTLDASFGYISTKSLGFRKNDDRFEYNAKAGKKIKGKFYYAGMFNFRTQFAPGFNFPNDSSVISRLMAPAYASLALGVDYKPKDYVYFFFSPVTGRATFVLDQRLANQGQFGVTAAEIDPLSGAIITPGRNVRWEFGASIRMRFQKDIFKNVNLLSNLQLFNNYSDPIKRNRGNIDVHFENMLNAKIGKLFNFSVFANLIYDHDINIDTGQLRSDGTTIVGPRTQFKQVIGFGLSYKWQ